MNLNKSNYVKLKKKDLKNDWYLINAENVIVGRLVPAGTGSVKNLWNKKASDDDKKFLSEQEAIEPSESQVNQ